MCQPAAAPRARGCRGRHPHGRRPSTRRALTAAGALLSLLTLSGCFGSPKDDSGHHASLAGRPKQRPKSTIPYWVNPDGSAARQVAAYRRKGADDEARLVQKIAEQPVAEWLGVDHPEGRARGFTKAADQVDREALLVFYSIPHRDCGQYSKGGAVDGDAYRAWLDRAVRGIGDRRTTVILEPDALPHVVDGCTPKRFHAERYDLLTGAVDKLKGLPHTKVYLDAGNPHWIKDPRRMAGPLKRAGIGKADGFALNTSNYQTTRDNTVYGKRLSALVGGKPFVIDTSRNGNGPAPGKNDPQAWCNPKGRALGERPTTETGDRLVDAYLWIKRPGESDGTCKGGPTAGRWWPRYALDLARNAIRRAG
ncbi:glycoside hydrolase family 6 protein [Streptomyces hygroscopicus]|uniref:glycoside hydrolase family 6 protein n=1 Tax=Streptomyces hygroscopicus TaxID=1912 RepID=UPI00082E411E|nr:glycoside hydrolase family 6 protein [Streptomyces hygroscopicus]GLV79981.1 glucanase [Streptomyces hygroscopicus subsp. hygroscopicus]